MANHESGRAASWPPTLTVCVGAVVLCGERALFVRQAVGHPLAGQWSIPWGLVDPEEPPEQAAARETREESGVTARIDGLLGIQNLLEPGWVAILFLGQHMDGLLTPDGGKETDGARYFSLAEMDGFAEPFEPWCEWLVRRVLAGQYRTIPFELENPYSPRGAFF